MDEWIYAHRDAWMHLSFLIQLVFDYLAIYMANFQFLSTVIQNFYLRLYHFLLISIYCYTQIRAVKS